MFIDEHGKEYEEKRAACIDAMQSLPQLVLNQDLHLTGRQLKATVRDGTGTAIYIASLILTGEEQGGD